MDRRRFLGAGGAAAVAPGLLRETLGRQGVVLSHGHPDTGRFALQVTLAAMFVEATAG